MSSAALQCPDSGLVVIVDSDGTACGDPDDWEEMGAQPGAIAATHEWLRRFNRMLRMAIRVRGRTITAFEEALRACDGDVSDLDALTWEEGALEVEGHDDDKGEGGVS